MYLDDGSGGRIDSPAMKAIREKYKAGAVIAGSSAGAMSQGDRIMVLSKCN